MSATRVSTFVLLIAAIAVSVATVSLASRPTNDEPSVDLSLPARPQLLEVARINAQLRGSGPAAGPAIVEPSVDLSLPARPQLLEVARINGELRSHPYEFVPPAR